MPVTVAEIMTLIQAAHVGQDTAWDLDARGGIVLCAYPEQLKTRMVERALRPYPDAMCVSDMNMRELGDIRGEFLSGHYNTVAFLDYQKVWERDERTSSNVEGAIRALTDEGWQGLAKNSRLQTKAKVFMVLCITPAMYEDKADEWKRNGFSRRMLFLNYIFRDRQVLIDAIKQGHNAQLSTAHAIPKPSERIAYTVTKSEADYVELMLKQQRGLIPMQLVLRIYNTLKWFYDEVKGEKDGAMQFMANIAPLFVPDGNATVVVNREPGLVRLNGDGTEQEVKPRGGRKKATA